MNDHTPLVVIDTNVFVAAMRSDGGASRAVIRACLERRCTPLMSNTLFVEYEDVMSRSFLFESVGLSPKEREQLFDAFLAVCKWEKIYFLFRPNLRDEGDNHLVELAVAGGADRLVTHNLKDFKRPELLPFLRSITPGQFVKEFLS